MHDAQQRRRGHGDERRGAGREKKPEAAGFPAFPGKSLFGDKYKEKDEQRIDALRGGEEERGDEYVQKIAKGQSPFGVKW